MTDYNKKTYRVDDVSWDASPRSTFKMRDENVSYIDYYYKVIYLDFLSPNQYFVLFEFGGRLRFNFILYFIFEFIPQSTY